MPDQNAVAVSHELTTDARVGRLILLNGTSSSGKTSIATELLDVLDGAWFHLGIDHFRQRRARIAWDRDALQRMVLGFHRAVAGMAAAGNDVVVDHLLGERWRLADCLSTFHDLPVYFVGVRCSLPELRRRELARGNRTVGRAELQFPLVHQPGVYDVEVDTEAHTPAECATLIRDRLAAGPPTAFDQLRSGAPGSKNHLRAGRG
jgi:chloramphenicol 3-O phosphotransferase